MYRLLRPDSIQPNKGDIRDSGEIVEIKGDKIRIISTITGRQYKKFTDDAFSHLIQGNQIPSGGLKGKIAYEIEKTQYNKWYKKEFKNADSESVEMAFIELLNNLDVYGDHHKLTKKIMKDGYNQSIYQQILLEDWFHKYKESCNFSKIILFGDGTNIKILRDDLSKIKIIDDYFRINQNSYIGWYIK
jgi:hypothetical protein